MLKSIFPPGTWDQTMQTFVSHRHIPQKWLGSGGGLPYKNDGVLVVPFRG